MYATLIFSHNRSIYSYQKEKFLASIWSWEKFKTSLYFKRYCDFAWSYLYMGPIGFRDLWANFILCCHATDPLEYITTKLTFALVHCTQWQKLSIFCSRRWKICLKIAMTDSFQTNPLKRFPPLKRLTRKYGTITVFRSCCIEFFENRT